MEPWQLDAYRTTDQTTVHSCAPSGDRWVVRTDPTILHPEGGGQPGDRGTIGGVAVLDVRKDADGVAHVTEGPVAPGPADVVVDWRRRFDLMQQHTGQHLLTAILLARWDVPTTSFHLGDATAHVDLGVARLPVTLDEVEEAVNAEILAARPVRSLEIDASEKEALGVRSRRIAAGVTGRLRLIEIDGLDLNTCGGTHLRSTAELQACKLLGLEKVRGEGLRLTFVYGGRVRTRLGAALAHEAALNRLLSVGVEGHVAAIERLAADKREAERRGNVLEAEVVDAIAARLADGAEDGVVALHREHGDARQLSAVATAALQRRAGVRMLLTAGDGAFLVAGDEAWVAEVGPEVADRFAGKGGGGRGRFQGRGDVSVREAVVGWLRRGDGDAGQGT